MAGDMALCHLAALAQDFLNAANRCCLFSSLPPFLMFCFAACLPRKACCRQCAAEW